MYNASNGNLIKVFLQRTKYVALVLKLTIICKPTVILLLQKDNFLQRNLKVQFSLASWFSLVSWFSLFQCNVKKYRAPKLQCEIFLPSAV